MDLVLIRHGETDENRRGVIQGHSRGTLSTLGKRQVKEAATKLKHERVVAIYSSDLPRCVDTAKPIHAHHPDVPLWFTPELRELHTGNLDKLPIRLPRGISKRMIHVAKRMNLKAPGGESWEDLRSRMGRYLNELYNEHPHDRILLVTHGIAMQAIHSVLNDAGEKEAELETVPNCAIWKLHMNKPVMVQG